jgi:hypothetical protein
MLLVIIETRACKLLLKLFKILIEVSENQQQMLPSEVEINLRRDSLRGFKLDNYSYLL